MVVDFLIIGQGLAGSVLALTLENNNQNCFIIDQDLEITSSKVAGGIMHPMSFKRCILSWKGNEFFDFSEKFYENYNQKFKIKTYKDLKLFRLFSSYEEQNNWIGKTSFEPYSSILNHQNTSIKEIKSQFGNGEVKKCGQLDVSEFLKQTKVFFKNKNRLINALFDPLKLAKRDGYYTYNDIQAKHVVLCQGTEGANNKLFNYLPLIPNKGELLTIETNHLPQVMLSKGIFTFPVKEKIFTLGATYSHTDYSETTTTAAKKELLSQMEKIKTLVDLRIIDHKYGFRPTTTDRKPLLGQHPTLDNLYIFNGMGSKGVLIAPLIAKELHQHIVNKQKLDPASNINRFSKKFTSNHFEFSQKISNQ